MASCRHLSQTYRYWLRSRLWISSLTSTRMRRLRSDCCSSRIISDTFIEETADGYQVGWFDHERKHLQHFAEFSQTADYLLFSFGKGSDHAELKAIALYAKGVVVKFIA